MAVLVAMAGLGPASLNMFLPSMPGLQRVFDTSYDTAQLVLTLYVVGLAFAQPVYGPLSDRHGRRPVMLVGLALYLVGTLACLVAPTIELLVAGRLVQAVGGCAGVVLSRAIVRDVYGRERAASVLAYVTMAMVVAPMAAPTVGGFLDDWYGWQASFLVMSAAGALLLAACALFLHETHAPAAAALAGGETWRSFAVLLRRRRFCGYAFQVSFSSGVFYAFITGAPYAMVEIFHRSASEYGLWFAMASVCYMAGNFIAGRTAMRLGSDRLIGVGTGLSLAGVALLGGFLAGGVIAPATLFGAMAVVAFGNGIAIPNALAGAVSVDPGRAGAASGAAGFVQMAVGATVSWSVGAMMAETVLPLVVVMAACSLAARGFYEWGVRRDPSPA